MIAATKRLAKLLFGAAFTVIFIVFSVSNRQPVVINLFPLLKAEMPLFIFTLLCFALGVITGGFVASCSSWQTKWQHGQVKRRVAALENEIKALHVEREEKPPAALGK